MKLRFAVVIGLATAGAALAADEGMWRFDQLPLGAVQKAYGVSLSQADLERLQRRRFASCRGARAAPARSRRPTA